ncbi:protein of unknown function [Brochothrix thermosphacta]|uniref:Uncharacterized protein n=1 Tax=Brochothrix thermosphacta TaxID=2756 RepID=A0A2X0R0R5_BROTH|nr:hypothetical protein FM106_15145 [Brachybacterium faecium]SPN72916.1 protein of unknown function [Brochothrix thermosphacta]SPP27640.1 hypothetical protein BTBSAS_170033 [Brochothrix thermosphacta]
MSSIKTSSLAGLLVFFYIIGRGKMKKTNLALAVLYSLNITSEC